MIHHIEGVPEAAILRTLLRFYFEGRCKLDKNVPADKLYEAVGSLTFCRPREFERMLWEMETLGIVRVNYIGRDPFSVRPGPIAPFDIAAAE
jgi:hypothetical protein